MNATEIKLESIKQIRLILNHHLPNASNYDAVIKGIETRILMTKDLLNPNHS